MKYFAVRTFHVFFRWFSRSLWSKVSKPLRLGLIHLGFTWSRCALGVRRRPQVVSTTARSLRTRQKRGGTSSTTSAPTRSHNGWQNQDYTAWLPVSGAETEEKRNTGSLRVVWRTHNPGKVALLAAHLIQASQRLLLAVARNIAYNRWARALKLVGKRRTHTYDEICA